MANRIHERWSQEFGPGAQVAAVFSVPQKGCKLPVIAGRNAPGSCSVNVGISFLTKPERTRKESEALRAAAVQAVKTIIGLSPFVGTRCARRSSLSFAEKRPGLALGALPCVCHFEPLGRALQLCAKIIHENPHLSRRYLSVEDRHIKPPR